MGEKVSTASVNSLTPPIQIASEVELLVLFGLTLHKLLPTLDRGTKMKLTIALLISLIISVQAFSITTRQLDDVSGPKVTYDSALKALGSGYTEKKKGELLKYPVTGGEVTSIALYFDPDSGKVTRRVETHSPFDSWYITMDALTAMWGEADKPRDADGNMYWVFDTSKFIPGTVTIRTFSKNGKPTSYTKEQAYTR